MVSVLTASYEHEQGTPSIGAWLKHDSTVAYWSVFHLTAVLCTELSVSQVCSVLESLEQEYKREEDWCGGADKLGPNSESDHVTPMISKHLEQKEAFLKVRNIMVSNGWRHRGTYTHMCDIGPDTCSPSAYSQACTLARRNADVFLKYLHRNSVNMPGMLSHVKAPETQVKSK